MSLSLRRRVCAAGSALALASGLAVAAAAPAASADTTAARSTGGVHVQQLRLVGTTNLAAVARASQRAATTAKASGPEIGRTVDRAIPRPGASSPPTVPAPRPSGSSVTGPARGFFGFHGLTHADQRLADNGNQFSLEPPDQGLCAGNGYTMEAVNTALTVYTTTGSQLIPPTSLDQFFGVGHEIDRQHNPPIYGPSVGDPKCYYDPQVNRWFLTTYEFETDPATGALGPRAAVFLSVSQTPDPTGAYTLFTIDTTDDGEAGTPAHPNCPCFGDQPLIGADANGFYVSTNEFPIYSAGFNGAQIYAISKQGLAAAADLTAPRPPVVHLEGGLVLGNASYSIQPALTPPGGAYPANKEYFLSSGDFNGTGDNRIFVWALANTASLSSASPSVYLTYATVPVKPYVPPVPALQKAGPRPLGQSLGEPLPKLQTNDDRMNQVYYAGGRLFSGLNTGLGSAAPNRTGIEWFAVAPTFSRGMVGGTATGAGYVAVANASVWFPSVALTSAGTGTMVFSLSGPTYYPSSAYVGFTTAGPTGPVRVMGAGVLPEDGFTCYPEYVGSQAAAGCRWGDYSAAVADTVGGITMASEYIGDAPRTSLANWMTFVGHQRTS